MAFGRVARGLKIVRTGEYDPAVLSSWQEAVENAHDEYLREVSKRNRRKQEANGRKRFHDLKERWLRQEARRMGII